MHRYVAKIVLFEMVIKSLKLQPMEYGDTTGNYECQFKIQGVSNNVHSWK